MIREEPDFKPPERQPRWIKEESAKPQKPQPVVQRSRWAPRLRIAALFVIVGLICIGIIHSDFIKRVVMVRVATARGDTRSDYSLMQTPRASPVKSADAVQNCKKLVEVNPEDVGAHVKLGNAYVEVGRSDEAILSYGKALSLDPNCFDAHLGLGKAHFDRGQYAEAISAYERALKIRPGSADAHLSLGLALSNSGRYEEAMQAFKKAKELDPHIARSQVMTGDTYLVAGMYAKAIECYEDAVRVDAGHAQAYFNLGRAYLRVGDTALAMEQQRILQDLNPRLAQQLLEMINQ